MAQIKHSVNLSAASFTFSLDFKGPSVVIPGTDQNYFQATSDWAGDQTTRGINIPQVMYCENTLPTAEGYRSVGYNLLVPGIDTQFSFFFTVFEGNGNSAVIGVTTDRKLYIFSAFTEGEWVELELPEGSNPWSFASPVTYASVLGYVGICIGRIGVYELKIAESRLENVELIGLNVQLIDGICGSSGYLIAYDKTTIYWSSTEEPTDFEPSIISGAGSAKVDGLKGIIQVCREIAGGFIIYSDISVISAAYTANQALPFSFDVIAGSAGIRDDLHVASDVNGQVHFAWTTSGLLGVELHQSRQMFPALTDFIASGTSDLPARWPGQYIRVDRDDIPKEIRVAVVAGRYLCISFGYFDEYPTEYFYGTCIFNQAFVYDLQLRRWGKLNIEHVQILEAPLTINYEYLNPQ